MLGLTTFGLSNAGRLAREGNEEVGIKLTDDNGGTLGRSLSSFSDEQGAKPTRKSFVVFEIVAQLLLGRECANERAPRWLDKYLQYRLRVGNSGG